MGLMDEVGKLAGGGGGGGLVGTVSNLIEKAGGVDGLVAKFRESGLGDRAESWVGMGDNKEVSADEVRQALGPDQVAQVAQDAGVSEEEAAGGLAGLLPKVIDQLTPDGKTPDLAAVTERLKGLDLGALSNFLK